MGSTVPSANTPTSFRDYNSREILKDFHSCLMLIKEQSKELSCSFAIAASDIQKIYQCFSNARRLSVQVTSLSFENAESEKLKRECLNCLAILEAGLCIEEEDVGSLPD
ncbi:hypothetical protein GCM10007867_29600 [Gluconobacter cerinus]|uniref:Uncharacterized protein n=1 Tax=Gluconobacter cerinus TaxID=38307 RepID=A0A1B6VPD9_9PROT|nr:hypothetical protein A0123_00144 [Gluconobacter cerinus]GLQ64114.1 hypothetical protein GCM10007867_29600 [Gluconobacter cerinus]